MKSQPPSSEQRAAQREPATTPEAWEARQEHAWHDSDARGRGVTLRVVLLCLALAVFFGYVIPLIDVRLSNTFLGGAHLPVGAIAVLLVMLLVVNPLLQVLSRATSAERLARWAFSRNEILTVYISCLFSALVPGRGGEGFFVPNLIASFYYATHENRWLEFLQPYLKPWFTPALTPTGAYNRPLVEGWYTGIRPTEAIPWSAWLVPVLAWAAFIFASYLMLGCLAVMLRAQWAEREALAFPLLRLPLEMTEDVDKPQVYGIIGRFFRNPLMWMGFGIAAFIQTLNGLNLYYPDVPRVPLVVGLTPLLTEAPWNQLSWVEMGVLPIVLGLSFLLTSEVSFSLWFFFWYFKAQYILAYYMGFPAATIPNSVGAIGDARSLDGYQQVGAFVAYVALVLWAGRAHFRHIARRAFGREKAGAGEKDEALSYPVAFWGFVLSFAFMVAWSVAAGVRWDVALTMWALYLVIAVGLTRVIVESGLLSVQQGWRPLGSWAQLAGSGQGAWLEPSSIVPAAFLQSVMTSDMRAFLMPSFVHGFKLAHDRKISAKPLLALIAACVLITFAISVYMNIHLGYRGGGGLSFNWWFANWGSKYPGMDANNYIGGVERHWLHWLWLGIGALTTYGIMLGRSHLPWLPLHPVGLLMSVTNPMRVMWFSIFLAWLCKGLITRFGGADSYRKAVPLFLGLALGDVVMMLFWLIIDGWQGQSGHQLMPG